LISWQVIIIAFKWQVTHFLDVLFILAKHKNQHNNKDGEEQQEAEEWEGFDALYTHVMFDEFEHG